MEDIDLSAILAPESDYELETPPAITELVGVDTLNTSEPAEGSLYGGESDDYRELFDEIGGAPVVEALTTLLNDENADLTSVLHPSQIESVVWQALDSPANQELILQDPDVQRAIADAFFEGRDLQSVRELVDYWADVEVDQGYQQEREYQLAESQAKEEQIAYDLQERFFVETEQDIAERFHLTDPDVAEIRSDIRLAAQARFLSEHAEDYLQVQRMLAQGHSLQAQVAEARLNNQWQATLIKTAERLGKVRPQQQAPGLSKPAKAKGNGYDIGSNDWLSRFVSDFKQERLARGL
jgi:hypothetical protein